MTKMARNVTVASIVTVAMTIAVWTASADWIRSAAVVVGDHDAAQIISEDGNRGRKRGSAPEVLDWNQMFIETLIAINTPNSSSQRLGAIVHTAIFDAFTASNAATRRFSSTEKAPTARRDGRRSLPRHTRRWSACSRRGNRRSMPAMRHRPLR